MPTIKAIETRYAGCRFRSRLEARWAVFFDTLGVKWEYELEGYEVVHFDDGVKTTYRYLPDFYLPATETWVEVKGTDNQADWALLATMLDWGSPIPGIDESYSSPRGLLLLGPIPFVDDTADPYWSCLQHHKGLGRVYAWFDNDGLVVSNNPTDECSAPDVPKGTSFEPEWAPSPPHWDHTTSAVAAYRAARSARFEHGESGASWR